MKLEDQFLRPFGLKRSQLLVLNGMLLLTMTAPAVAGVYVANLVQPISVVQPVSLHTGGGKPFLHGDIFVGPGAFPNDLNGMAPEAPKSAVLLNRVLQGIKEHPTQMLWSSYPASVRGRLVSLNNFQTKGMLTGGW